MPVIFYHKNSFNAIKGLVFCFFLNHYFCGCVYHSDKSWDMGGYSEVRHFYKMAKGIFFFFFWLFRATPAAYGGFQARGWNGAAAAGIHHSNAGSLTHWARPRDQTCNLIVPSQICFCAMTGTSKKGFFFFNFYFWLHPWLADIPRPEIKPMP